jgi:nucleotide-binding universal stress UspA family protein
MRLPFRTILCPTDLSPVGNSAVTVAYGLADAGATVHLLYVCEPAEIAALAHGHWAPAYMPTPEERHATEEKLREQLHRLVPLEAEESGIRTEIHVAHGFPVADRIEELAHAHHADVVIIGTHGRTGIGRVVMGSVATDVMRRKGLSVLLVHDDRVVHATPVEGKTAAAGSPPS